MDHCPHHNGEMCVYRVAHKGQVHFDTEKVNHNYSVMRSLEFPEWFPNILVSLRGPPPNRRQKQDTAWCIGQKFRGSNCGHQCFHPALILRSYWIQRLRTVLIALSHQKRHARMARVGLRESYSSRPSLTWTLLRRQTESVVPTHSWPSDATTTVSPVENPLTPFTTGKQRRRNRSEAEETTDSTAPSVYNIPYKHFPRSKQIAENVPNEAHHRPLFVSLNAESVDCDQASPATDHRASEPSTSERITPACSPPTLDAVTVTRLTQQRLWKVGKMVAVLSLIIFIANTPSTVLMFISTLEAQIQRSKR